MDESHTTDVSTKQCGRCRLDKPLTDFARHGRRFQHLCRICDGQRAKEWRTANPEKWRASRAPSHDAFILRILTLVREAKQRECADCGRSFPWFVMDFDHVRGEKLANVSTINSSLVRAEEEIAKCEVVCARCHRIRTWQRSQLMATPAGTGIRAFSTVRQSKAVRTVSGLGEEGVVCAGCKIEQPVSAFKRGPRSGLRCAACRAEYQTAWHQTHGVDRLAAARARKLAAIAYVDQIKTSSSCTDCRESFPANAMDFDHLRDKRRDVSSLVRSGASIETINIEIAKCELVCANCHRVRTHIRRLIAKSVFASGSSNGEDAQNSLVAIP